MADPHLPRRLRHLAAVVKGERRVEGAARAALEKLLTLSGTALRSAGLDDSVLDNRVPEWRDAVTGELLPSIEAVFLSAWAAADTLTLDPSVYVSRHLEAVTNRLVAVADSTFDVIRTELNIGRLAGEDMRKLTTRVDALLADSERWDGRARTIARTEVIGANNAGLRGNARATAEVLGYAPGEVLRQWLSTSDSRTRASHIDADGQQVMGLDTPYLVGDAELEGPGDPNGPGEEVINCRCTELFIYPGDPDYPAGGILAAGVRPEEATAMTAAPPEAPTPVEPADAEIRDDLPDHGADTNIAATCPGCDTQVVFDTGDGWQRLDGTTDHDDGTTHNDWLLPPPDDLIAEATADDAPPEDEGMTRLLSSTGGDPVERIRLLQVDSGMTPEDFAAALAHALFTPVVEPLSTRGPQYADDPTVPAPPPEEVPGLAQDISPDGDPLYGILWPEGVESGDGRMVEVDATVWRDLPLPIMVQIETAEGHDGAVRCARIDHIWRDSDRYATPVIRYDGVWDTSEAAQEAQRQVDNKILRGLSVDGDGVVVELRGSDGQPLDPMVDDFPEDGIVVEVATQARVAGATGCSIPAFVQAYIANGVYDPEAREPGWNDDGTATRPDQLPAADAAALAASAAPAWTLTAAAEGTYTLDDFRRPDELDNYPTGCPLTVTDDGRVYGHVAAWGLCHIGIDGNCIEPPSSPSGYAHFAVGSVPTPEGRVHVGQLTMDTGHADLRLGARPAAAHYDNTGSAVADIAVGEDHIGPWYAGRLRPGVTEEQIHAMRASGKVSGDWREAVRGTEQLELVGVLVVNVHGFSIPRPALAASATGVTAMVAAGIVSTEREPVTDTLDAATIARNVLATLDRREKVRRASSRIRRQRADAAIARLRRFR